MPKQNITLSADAALIERARSLAVSENTTLNSKFRNWLDQYVNASARAEKYVSFMKSVDHVRVGRKFTREELNER
ncbi:MAG: hypothetical protein GY866_31505 [Proteobacteria bacterium]|nr:hypothetical protein [Pseudomonadota bacterium]